MISSWVRCATKKARVRWCHTLRLKNDDGSSERMNRLLRDVALSDEYLVPWNAYPWQVHQDYPNSLVATHVDEGVNVLRGFLEVAPHVPVIVAHGGTRDGACGSIRRYIPDFAKDRQLVVIETRRTSNRAFIMISRKREATEEEVREKYRDATRTVGLKPAPPTQVQSVKRNLVENAIAVLLEMRAQGTPATETAPDYIASFTASDVRELTTKLLVAEANE